MTEKRNLKVLALWKCKKGVSEAIAKLDNTDFMGRTIRVTEANPKKS